MSRGATFGVTALAAVAVTACGGSSKPTRTETAHHSAAHAVATVKAPPPLQQLLPRVKGAKPSENASVTAGTSVELIVRVPAADASKSLTVSIERTGSTTFAATSAVLGTPLKQSGVIQVSGANAQISAMTWKCAFPSSTFCPVHVASSSPSLVRLNLPHHQGAVKLTIALDRPGAAKHSKAPIQLGPPAPGSPVQATLKLSASGSGSGGKAASTPAGGGSVTAAPGSVIRVAVRLAPGSPAQGTLRIAIPRTSGPSIEVQAGGTASSPSSTATVSSSAGAIRVSRVVWRCELPPATFCPFSSVHATASGIALMLPTPRVPVVLSLTTEKG